MGKIIIHIRIRGRGSVELAGRHDKGSRYRLIVDDLLQLRQKLLPVHRLIGRRILMKNLGLYGLVEIGRSVILVVERSITEVVKREDVS